MQTILSDVDGVILDFLSAFKKYLKTINIKIETIKNYENIFLKYGKYYYDFIYNGMPFNYYNGALDYFNYLSKNYNLVLITAIEKTVKKSRIENLKELNYNDIIFTKEKEKYLKKYNPVAIYEDCPDTIKKYLKKYSGFIYCPIRPYTKKVNYKQVIKYDYC
jgi:hypothetical protein